MLDQGEVAIPPSTPGVVPYAYIEIDPALRQVEHKGIYKDLLTKHADSEIVSVHKVAITDNIMRCDFYKDEYQFEKVLKEHIGVKEFKLVEGQKPYMEMKFFFDDKKEARMFGGAEVSGGALTQKATWFAPRIKFTDPFMMTLQTDGFPPGGMYIVLCADENLG